MTKNQQSKPRNEHGQQNKEPKKGQKRFYTNTRRAVSLPYPRMDIDAEERTLWAGADKIDRPIHI